jgi:hypothetical protein
LGLYVSVGVALLVLSVVAMMGLAVLWKDDDGS